MVNNKSILTTFNEADNGLSQSEYNSLLLLNRQIYEGKDILDGIDINSLKKLKKSLLSEKELYNSRSNILQKRKDNISKLVDNVVNYIDKKIGSLSKIQGKSRGIVMSKPTTVSQQPTTTETINSKEKITDEQFQQLIKEPINGKNTLKASCEKLGIEAKALQRYIYGDGATASQIDGIIGGGTYRKFKEFKGRLLFQNIDGGREAWESENYTYVGLKDMKGHMNSLPFQRSRTGSPICSRTAYENLQRLGVNISYLGNCRNAIDAFNVLKRKNKISYSMPNGNDPFKVVDLYMKTASKYDHRAAGYKLNGKRYIMDPYYSRHITGKRGDVRPMPLDKYIRIMKAKGLGTFMGVRYFA